jgi:retron-type reverse transcriptase
MRTLPLDYEQAYVAEVRAELQRVGLGERADSFDMYAMRLLGTGVPVLFDERHLARVLGLRPSQLVAMAVRPERHYTSFRIAKRRGGSRLIEAPSTTLKHIQRYIQVNIAARLAVSDSAHGFRPGRSIATNARPHVGSPLIVKYDVQDFFGSIGVTSIRPLFRGLGYSSRVSDMLVALCTLRGVLPQGAPTSPDLANAAAAPLDRALEKFVGDKEIAYTRYADDLTFSGPGVEVADHRRKIEWVVAASGFTLNQEKSCNLSRATRQRVTGVVVNEKLNWPRERRRWLRQELHHLERVGVEQHLRARAARHPEYARASYKEYIYGHVLALNSVRPDEGSALLERLDRITWPY